MSELEQSAQHSAKSLARLLPRLENRFRQRAGDAEWEAYAARVKSHFPRLFRLLHKLYGHQYDFFYHLEALLTAATEMWLQRSDELKALDAMREADPLWYQSPRLIGAMCYVDLFAGTLSGLRERIPYLTELGITYLHLLPLYRMPEGENDGGYAVSNYREVHPPLGTMAELAELSTDLRHHGISLCLDFIFNHTSDEHEWARKALAGDPTYQDYYYMFPDRELPDQYEKTIPPVFPDDHPGCFTYRNRIRKWVWTTFHNFQWDLNYQNPEVFTRMAEEMLFVANQGVEILRIDAVAFGWKRLGTSCQNLPEAHMLIQAFNAVASIVAPATIFKSEAIVHPDEVLSYIGEHECQISYNPLLMALLWNSLATKKVRLLRHSLIKRFAIPDHSNWVNYVRSHDDIGWTFSNDDATELTIDPVGHREFLSKFYTSQLDYSFAIGLPFHQDPTTGEARISGTTASLAGLEKARAENDPDAVSQAINRILLVHGVIFTLRGIPLIHLGDELGTLNDYSFRDNPERESDSRWVHRRPYDPELAAQRHDAETIAGRIFLGLLRLVQIRQQHPVFSGIETEFIDTGNDHVLAYFRHAADSSALVLANFSPDETELAGKNLRLFGLRKVLTDIVAGATVTATQRLVLEPYQFMVLTNARQ